MVILTVRFPSLTFVSHLEQTPCTFHISWIAPVFQHWQYASKCSHSLTELFRQLFWSKVCNDSVLVQTQTADPVTIQTSQVKTICYWWERKQYTENQDSIWIVPNVGFFQTSPFFLCPSNQRINHILNLVFKQYETNKRYYMSICIYQEGICTQ